MAASLKTIKKTLKRIITLFTFQGVANNVGTITLKDIPNIKEITDSLKELNLFSTQVNLLTNSVIYTTKNTSMNIQNGDWNIMNASLNTLKELITNFIIVLDEIVIDEDPNSINIKLPDTVNDFNRLAIVSNELNLCISQILLASDVQCETKIISIESGSIWENILIIAEQEKILLATTLIGHLIRSAIKLRKEWFEGSKLKEEFKKLKIENDKLTEVSEIEKTIDKRKETIVKTEAAEIKKQYFKNDSTTGDTTNLRIEDAIKTLADLQDKGLLITLSINAKQENVDLFPTISEMQLLENKTKEIESPRSN